MRRPKNKLSDYDIAKGVALLERKLLVSYAGVCDFSRRFEFGPTSPQSPARTCATRTLTKDSAWATFSFSPGANRRTSSRRRLISDRSVGQSDHSEGSLF